MKQAKDDDKGSILTTDGVWAQGLTGERSQKDGRSWNPRDTKGEWYKGDGEEAGNAEDPREEEDLKRSHPEHGQ